MDFVILVVLAIFAYLVIKNKINIDIRSFFSPSLPLTLGKFGVYCFTGKQGTGKTYAVNKFIRKHAQGRKIYSNITFEGLEYTHLTSMKQMLALMDERDCYIIYDEIFTIMQKSTRFGPEIMTFLSQMRKQENIFITTAQEWLELPMTYRRFVRIQIECETRPLGALGGIIHETYYDARKMKWSQLDNEYIAPLITHKVSKYEKRFMISYDTHERIKTLV